MPEELEQALGLAAHKLAGRQGADFMLAVRSSAEEEDGDFSFAGQFESVLNVPATAEAIGAAWRQVAASLFTPRAAAYQRQLGYDLGRLRMAVACVAMVEARASGVTYTVAGPGPERHSSDQCRLGPWPGGSRRNYRCRPFPGRKREKRRKSPKPG